MGGFEMKVAMQWANVYDIESQPYKYLHSSLRLLESSIPTYRHDSDHNGRRFEYPWAILNSSPANGVKILNAGSGTDVLGFYLSRYGYTINVDKNPDVIRDGKAQAGDKFPRLDFRVADMKTLPFADGYFDRVYCISAMEHGSEPMRVYYEELLRVTRVGGILMITIDVGDWALPESAVRETFGSDPPPKPNGVLAIYRPEDTYNVDKKYIYVLAIKVVKT